MWQSKHQLMRNREVFVSPEVQSTQYQTKSDLNAYKKFFQSIKEASTRN